MIHVSVFSFQFNREPIAATFKQHLGAMLMLYELLRVLEHYPFRVCLHFLLQTIKQCINVVHIPSNNYLFSITSNSSPRLQLDDVFCDYLLGSFFYVPHFNFDLVADVEYLVSERAIKGLEFFL